MVEVRGTVHWLTHKDGPARALHVDPAARARLPRVLGETGQVVWVTDVSGADALEIGSVTGETETLIPRVLASGSLGYVMLLTASPDGATVAASARDGRLLIVDVASGQVTELATSGDGLIEGLSWSPDSAWLAWSEPVGRSQQRIRMARIADATIIDVTDGRFADTSPVFTLDGLYLAFLSQRSFDPVYDAHTFDLSFPFGGRPYLVPLAASPRRRSARYAGAGRWVRTTAMPRPTPWPSRSTRTAWPRGCWPSRWRRAATATCARSRAA